MRYRPPTANLKESIIGTALIATHATYVLRLCMGHTTDFVCRNHSLIRRSMSLTASRSALITTMKPISHYAPHLRVDNLSKDLVRSRTQASDTTPSILHANTHVAPSASSNTGKQTGNCTATATGVDWNSIWTKTTTRTGRLPPAQEDRAYGTACPTLQSGKLSS